MAPGPQARYVHLTGDDALLSLNAEPDAAPYLESANARITGFIRDSGGNLSLDVRGHQPLRLVFANATTCRAQWNNRPLPFTRQGHRLIIENARHASARPR